MHLCTNTLQCQSIDQSGLVKFRKDKKKLNEKKKRIMFVVPSYCKILSYWTQIEPWGAVLLMRPWKGI